MTKEISERRPVRGWPTRGVALGVLMVILTGGSASPSRAEETRALALGGGVFNFSKGRSSAEGGLEYRQPTGVWGLTGALGLSGTEEGSFWVFAGLRRDLRLAEGWWVTPAFAVALYEKGDGRDLGGPVEFRSAIEISHEWPKRQRLALAFYHLSNAGIYDLNPGSNSLVLTLSFPLWR